LGDHIKKNEIGGHVARMGNGRGAYGVLVGRPQGMNPLGTPRVRRESSIKIDFQRVGWRGMDWIDMAQDTERWRPFVNVAMKIRLS